MSPQLDAERALWRVGYHADPLGFVPPELYEFSHRFDDIAIWTTASTIITTLVLTIVNGGRPTDRRDAR